MKKTSRRTFGKQLGGVLAALPLASVVANAQRRPPAKSRPAELKTRFKSEHNTPPPELFMGGSLVFETFSAKDDWDLDGDPSNNNTRRKWSVTPRPYDGGPSPSNIYIAHLKLIDGAGNNLCPYDNVSDIRTQIHITATLTKNTQSFGDIHLTAVGDHFELDLPFNKRLKKKSGDPPANSRRQRVRYMHPSIGNPDLCEWAGLRIVKGREVIYNEPNLPGLEAYDETMRLMIWWANLP